MSSYREKALNAHGEECVNCGAEDGIEVHHLNGDREDNDIENLVPLCRHCHRRLHREGLNGLEKELKPVDERSHIDPGTTSYQFSVPKSKWERWKQTVPRTKSLDARLRELIKADATGRVIENSTDPADREDVNDA